jgi:hypothetical protein
MPPRLLSADTSDTAAGHLAVSYGFVDTVHGVGGESSVWTQNRFCNQYAAMPSLHFGYSLLIGLTIMSFPLARGQSSLKIPYLTSWAKLPSWRRMVCVVVGITYPFLILVAILATANHFILDAVAGGLVCALAWWGNSILLNLLVVEDHFLQLLRICKPEFEDVDEEDN